jgi:hypothetical protein
MPLRALINDNEVLAPLVSDNEWEVFKNQKPSIVLPNCGHSAFLRKSKLGTKHFVHKTAKACNCSSETWQHLLAKTEIVKACHKAGYDAKTEVSGVDWRADVLATKQTSKKLIKIAFEVQWSHQSLEETQARQAKYERDGIRCCWLFKRLPTIVQSKDLPMFQLSFEENVPQVAACKKKISLVDFIENLLLGKFDFCKRYTLEDKTVVKVVAVKHRCPRCAKKNCFYYIYGDVKSICGKESEASFILDDDEELCELLGRETGRKLFKKAAKDFFYNSTSRYEDGYVAIWKLFSSFTCLRCKYQIRATRETESREIGRVEILNQDMLLFSASNSWCYSPNRTFCKYPST